MVGKLMEEYLRRNVAGDPVELLAAMLQGMGIVEADGARGMAASVMAGEVEIGVTVVLKFCYRFDCQFRADGSFAYFCGSDDE